MKIIILIYIYYIVWFGSLILAANNFVWLPLLLSLFFNVFQLYFCCDLSKVVYWKKFLPSLICLGFVLDCIFTVVSFINFQTNPFHPYFAPPWRLALWINFAVLCIGLVDILEQFRKYLWLFALLGFPVAYLGGVGFHISTFKFGTSSAMLIGLIWVFLFPALCQKLLFKHPHPQMNS